MRSTALALSLALLLGASAHAASFNLSVFSTNYNADVFYGYAYDPTTQTYYSHSGYSTATLINSYNSAAAFAANTPSSSVNLSSGQTHGTYFGVLNGSVFAHDSQNSPSIAKWDASTGALQSTASHSQFNAINGSGSFNWGGYSSMNIFRDNSSLYLFAKSDSTGFWTISTLNPDLSVSNTVSTNLTSAGYAFLINGTLYVGNLYNNNTVTNAINVNTGVNTPVNHTFLFPNMPYISNTVYDQTQDRLYFYNTTDSFLYSLDNASTALGGVPEPATSALLGAALIALGCLRRRH